MLRPIAENLFEERQIAGFQFAEIIFTENLKIRKFAENLLANFGISSFLGNSIHMQFANEA
jgi:hypothetical protein